MEVFDSQQVRRWLAGRGAHATGLLPPLRTLEVRSGGYKSPIREARWSETSAAIQFMGADAAGVDQVYRLELPSGKLQALTGDTFEKYSILLANDVLLYQRRVPLSPPEPSRRVIVPVRRNDVGDIEFRWGPATARLDWVASYRGGESWVLPIGIDFVPTMRVWFSPDGRRAVTAPEDITGTPQRFMLFDFARQQVQPLSEVAAAARSMDRKSPTAAQVFWTPAGNQAIVVNIALPAGQAPAAGQPAGYVAAFDVESGHWQVLEAMKESGAAARQVRALGWLKGGEEFLITHELGGQPVNGTVYARQGDRWVGRAVPASWELAPPKKAGLPGGLTVAVRQSANDPPVLMAAEGGRERALSKPDPALQGIWRARQEPFTWRMPDGSRVTGGLSLPRSAEKGTRVPLVIQAGYYRPKIFLPDASVPAGFAHQALVAQGMAVLEMNSFDLPGMRTAREGPDFVARLDAAVDALALQGMIDPQRVGVIGHSRSGYLTHYAITHPARVHLAAAEVWDSWTGSYSEYLEEAVFTGFTGDFKRTNGGPFWQNKAEWLEHDVLFNADRMDVPTLFVENGKGAVTAAGARVKGLMTLGAYQLNRRPVEFLSIPEGGHVLTRVRERKPAMDVAVDWMRFWLQGQEDPSAEKAEQYARWRLIRRRNEERKNEE